VDADPEYPFKVIIGFSGIPVKNPDFNTARMPSATQYLKIRMRATEGSGVC
jgi:hypothetical protein